MEINSINASTFVKMFLNGAKALEAKKEWINELNVFPVPDGDTGTNMTMTVMSAANEVGALENPNMATVAKAVSSGSLRGARGNSGVILSQLFRGFSKVIAKETELTTPILAAAFQKAVETAYKAVMKPKEGTILTVARESANKALQLAEQTDDLVVFGAEALKEAERVLKKTPEMLPVLKQAGVVDSGGQGLVVFLQGAYDALLGKELDISVAPAKQTSVLKISKETEAEIRFGYCTEFIIVLDQPLSAQEERNYKTFLESIGDSIVVVADDEIVKTHVHTNDPGLAIQEALAHGSLSKIKIDNMREEHEERLIKNATQLAAQQKEEENNAAQNKQAQNNGTQNNEAQNSAQSESPNKQPDSQTDAPHKEFGFIPVSAGEGLSEIFTGLGADFIIEGGQTMNPSTQDILNAVEAVHADHIFVFPNNKNIILAANQAAELCEDKDVKVIPTTTIPQGITAMINFIPEQSAEENAGRMEAEIKRVKTGQVTYAVRDTVIDDKQIKQDDYMGVGDHTILSAGRDLTEVTLQTAESMIDEESVLVSIYYGAEADEDAAIALADKLQERHAGIETEVQYGGQPIYYYLISVE